MPELKRLVQEMTSLGPLDPTQFPKPELEFSLIIPAKKASHSLDESVRKAHQFFDQKWPGRFEIILVPNPAPNDLEDRSLEIARILEQDLTQVRVVPHSYPPGKGAAIRTGFAHSRGKWIFYTDSDLPYGVDFFERALVSLKKGVHLVSGNRRLPDSFFHVPVTLLPLAYGRHRLGLWFNSLVRKLLPIQTTDTQAGIKALSRTLALQAFSKQTCPGFLFDIELFMVAHRQGYSTQELSITLSLTSEKSTVRILRECLLVAYWLFQMKRKDLKGIYGTSKLKPLLARYRHCSLPTRFFLNARWWLTPYSKMISLLPQEGAILDLGCGHGLLSIAAGIKAPTRRILGIDHDSVRITAGIHASRDLPQVQFKAGPLLFQDSASEFDAITLIDVMHYFKPEEQEKLIAQAFQLLRKGGTLLIRDVDPHCGWISRWNRFYEKCVTQIGFTRSQETQHSFRSKAEWHLTLEKAGFKVRSERCSSFLFADVLYICERA